jgi:hypothetical protein
MSLLPELAEADATGELAAIYGEFRAFARVPYVSLIYRHLATMEGVLPLLWWAVRPAFASGALADAGAALMDGATLPKITPIAGVEWQSVGLGAREQAAIANLLDGYNRANPINLVFVRLIETMLAGGVPAAPGTWLKPGRPERAVRKIILPLPPMPPSAAIPPALAERLARLTQFPEAEAGLLVPSLYRHLAHWPDFLALLPGRLEPAFAHGWAARAGAAYDRAARTSVAEIWPLLSVNVLPLAPERRARLADTLTAFGRLLPEIIAVGRLIRLTLPRGV